VPDQLTDDQLEALFADLRADGISRVTPPGTAATRRTVRRRRSTAASVAVLGVMVIAGVPVVARFAEPVPPASDAGLRFSDGVPADVQRAEQQVSDDVIRNATLVSGPADDGYSATADVFPGSYTFRFACVGDGSVQASVMQGGTRLAGVTVECTASGQRTATPVTIPDLSSVYVSEADAQVRVTISSSTTDHRAAFAAMMVTTPGQAWVDGSYRAVMADAGDGTRTATRGTFKGSAGGDVERGAAPGRYRLRAACAGTGSMMVAAQRPPIRPANSDLLAAKLVRCASVAQLVRLEFRLERVADLHVTLTPDQEAETGAGYAYLLERY
jgi:hypothetical protein